MSILESLFACKLRLHKITFNCNRASFYYEIIAFLDNSGFSLAEI